MEPTVTLDVRIIEPRFKHPKIFQGFDELKKGQSLVIINDHDPLPLYYQFKAERPELFDWEYLEEGPATWRVKIEKIKDDQTVADILLENPQAATIFKKYDIDYCRDGARAFDEVCKERGRNPEELKNQISETVENRYYSVRAKNWSLEFLTDYIVNNHHQYILEMAPEMVSLSKKVALVHGEHHPELKEVDTIIKIMTDELIHHSQKEEKVLFPSIKEVGKGNSPLTQNSISEIVELMNTEHSHASDGLERIKKLTNNFSVPEDACASYRLLFDMLKSYEEDLQQHIHLEDNILFPKAINAENRLTKRLGVCKVK